MEESPISGRLLRVGQAFDSYRHVNRALEKHKMCTGTRLALKTAIKLEHHVMTVEQLQEINMRLKYSKLSYSCILATGRNGRPGNDERCPKLIRLELSSNGRHLVVMETHSHESDTSLKNPPELPSTPDITLQPQHPLLLNGDITVTPIHKNITPAYSPVSPGVMTLIPLTSVKTEQGIPHSGVVTQMPVSETARKSKSSQLSTPKLSNEATKKVFRNDDLATISPISTTTKKQNVQILPNGATITPLSLQDLESISKQTVQYKPIAPKVTSKAPPQINKKTHTLIAVGPSHIRKVPQSSNAPSTKKPSSNNYSISQPQKSKTYKHAQIPTSTVQKVRQDSTVIKKPKVPNVPVTAKQPESPGNNNVESVKKALSNNSELTVTAKNGKIPSPKTTIPVTNGINKSHITTKKPLQNGVVPPATSSKAVNGSSQATMKVLPKKKICKPHDNFPEKIASPPLDMELPYSEKLDLAHPLLLSLLEATSRLPMKDFSHAIETLQTVADAYSYGHRVTVSLKREKEEFSFNRHELYEVHYETEESRMSSPSTVPQLDGGSDSSSSLSMLEKLADTNEPIVQSSQPHPPQNPIVPPCQSAPHGQKRKITAENSNVAKKSKT